MCSYICMYFMTKRDEEEEREGEKERNVIGNHFVYKVRSMLYVLSRSSKERSIRF